MSYAQESYDRETTAMNRLAAAFFVAAILLWPASWLISGHGETQPDWWNATTVAVWIAAAACSVGFGVTGVIRLITTRPIEGANR